MNRLFEFMTNEAVGQYRGWPRVVREMATHFPESKITL